jgi:hypothetical protein
MHRCTRSLVCKSEKHTSKSPQVHRIAPAFPARMVLTVSSALSPVNGLSCHRHPREALASLELDTGVVMSGPHGFAVRVGALRLVHRRVHRIPHPTSVTIAIRPS